MDSQNWFEFVGNIFQDSVGKGAMVEPFLAADRPEQIEFFNRLQRPLAISSFPVIRLAK